MCSLAGILTLILCRFCGSEGLNEPEGLCGAGYYCALGATSPVLADETNASVGGLCDGGYACIEARQNNTPSNFCVYCTTDRW